MTTITEIAPDIFRINTFVPEGNLGFSQFLVRDEEPLLYHTGMRGLFPVVLEAVSRLIDPVRLRWVGFSHFEADECGSLNEWQTVAPNAIAVCSMVGKMVSVDDFAPKHPARGMADGEEFSTGAKTFQFISTPQVPHCWEAGMLYESTNKVLFCSDLLHQNGDVEALTSDDVSDSVRQTLVEYQAGPMANYLPYTPITGPTIERLASLEPHTLAVMHGSVVQGNGAQRLRDYGTILREVLLDAA